MKIAVLTSSILAALVSTSSLAATVYKDETSSLKLAAALKHASTFLITMKNMML